MFYKEVVVKNLALKEQETVKIDDLIEYLDEILIKDKTRQYNSK